MHWVRTLTQQLAAGSTTYVFLHGSPSTWRTELVDVSTEDPDEPALVPAFYAPDSHHTLWVKLRNFVQVSPADIMEQYVLSRSGNPITTGSLANQTPLIVRAKAGKTHGTLIAVAEPDGAFTPESVRDQAVACGLTLPSEIYPQLVAALESGKHIILTGPPGTAKTTLAQAVAEAARLARRTRGYVLTTATSDWTTFETIGGLRPTPTNELEFEEGHFLRATIRNNEWLVIDELNRSNFDRAFGQLFTVLSGQSVVLPYQRPGRRLTSRSSSSRTAQSSPVENADVLAVPAVVACHRDDERVRQDAAVRDVVRPHAPVRVHRESHRRRWRSSRP